MTVTARPALEVADIIREHGDEFRQQFARILTPAQKKALRDLARCRTAALGGHVERCLDCTHERIAYNSCRNRHCPKCQAQSRARWLAAQAEHLLPVEYYHLVFTLPDGLSDLARANASTCYDLLFQSTAATIREVAANPKHLGAMPGMLLVLHTWGQKLTHHPHVHGVVTGGGLSCDASGRIDAAPRWVPCRKGFFLPVKVLSRVFRGKYLDGLRQVHAQGKLRLFGRLAPLAGVAAFQAFLRPLYRTDWVVYAKRPFGGPKQVLKYLAMYTHRVAISNHRLVRLENGRVTFRYKDYADKHKQKLLTLDACEFLRRFVQHVLPAGFTKIRHYGLVANRFRAERLALCRRLLLAERVLELLPQTGDQEAIVLEPVRVQCCPQCGSPRLVCVPLVPATLPDTS